MFNKLLVPVDGSPHSKRAVSMAAQLARCCDASLVLAHAIQDLSLPKEILEMIASGEVTASRMQILQDSAEIMLGDARELCREAGLSDVETEVLMGDPASQILEYAERNGVDLIVIGQRGLATRTGLLGGVARKIVNTSGISCLIAT